MEKNHLNKTRNTLCGAVVEAEGSNCQESYCDRMTGRKYDWLRTLLFPRLFFTGSLKVNAIFSKSILVCFLVGTISGKKTSNQGSRMKICIDVH